MGSTLTRIYCTFVSRASASVSARSVLFMVNIYCYRNEGKHKDHEVKTIKKSHPIIKGEL